MSKEIDLVPPPSTRHQNGDLFIWALNLVGGRDDYVEIEDAYYKCFELAPKRFSWRTRPELPDLTLITIARRQVVKRQNESGMFLIDALGVDTTKGVPGAQAHRWRLTSLGVQWCDRYQDRLESLYGGGSIPVPSKRTESRRIRELRESDLFKQWTSEEPTQPSRVEVAVLLECSPASEKKVFDLRLDQAEEDARWLEDNQVIDFIKWLRGGLG